VSIAGQTARCAKDPQAKQTDRQPVNRRATATPILQQQTVSAFRYDAHHKVPLKSTAAASFVHCTAVPHAVKKHRLN